MFEWDQTSKLTEHFIKEYDENSNTGYFLYIKIFLLVCSVFII